VKIERQLLIDLGKRETERRAAEADIVSGYLIGSVARGEPQIGGTADIDLVLIHDHKPAAKREVVHLSPEVHLDIAHHDRELYSRPSELRIHRWIGPAMCEPIFLFDPEHFFEWAQAGARGQFFRADHMYARAQGFLRQARSASSILPVTGRWIKIYLKAVMEAANSVACLTGFPVAGRRVILELEAAARELECEHLADNFLSLLGAGALQSWSTPELLSSWARAFDAAAQHDHHALLTPPRREYYLSAFQVLAEEHQTQALIWHLLRTWETSIHTLESLGIEPEFKPAWESLLDELRLSSEWHAHRQDQLKEFLEKNQRWIEHWAERHGA
jgi:predicted nucleotidyltransferase